MKKKSLFIMFLLGITIIIVFLDKNSNNSQNNKIISDEIIEYENTTDEGNKEINDPSITLDIFSDKSRIDEVLEIVIDERNSPIMNESSDILLKSSLDYFNDED